MTHARGQQCLERLTSLGVKWAHGRRVRGVATPVRIPEMELGGVKLVPLNRRRPRVMDCHLALALASTAGPALRQLGVTALRYTSLYDYRRVKGRRMLSRHAVGLAIDILDVVTEDGVVHRVPRHYRRRGSALRAVERALNQLREIRRVLSPGNDRRGHWDHFHIEARTAQELARFDNS